MRSFDLFNPAKFQRPLHSDGRFGNEKLKRARCKNIFEHH